MYTIILVCNSYEKIVYDEWAEGVDAIAKTNLEKPLLKWEGSDSVELLKVNFDSKVHHVAYKKCTCTCVYFSLHVAYCFIERSQVPSTTRS